MTSITTTVARLYRPLGFPGFRHIKTGAQGQRLPHTQADRNATLPRVPDSLSNPESQPLRAAKNTSRHWFKSHRMAAHERLYSTSTKTSTMGQLDPILPPALLGELQKLWFKHVLSEDDMVVPCQDTMMKWFKKDEEFDRTCS